MTTTTNLNQLKINKMTQAQYSSITPNANELYLTTDEIITSTDVTSALGYTPYNGTTNPNGYTSNIGTVTSVNNTNPDNNGNVSITIPDTSNLANKDLSNLSSTGEAKFQSPISDLSTIRSNASHGETAYNNIDGNWTASGKQVLNNTSLNGSSDFTFDLTTYLPNTTDLYEILITANCKTGTTAGNNIAVIASIGGYPIDIFLCSARTTANGESHGSGSCLITAKRTDTFKIKKSTNYTGTCNVWFAKYRKVR